MTLENIFFGKKVVKQAYFNNALIYQAKGWETLPSTCQEVWTKSYDAATYINAMAKDDDDNLYICIGTTLYKMDAEGSIKWKCTVGKGTACPPVVTAIVACPTYIYCAYFGQSTVSYGYISKIDVDGNLISDKSVNDFLSGQFGTFFVDMQREDNYIYAILQTGIVKLSFDLELIDSVIMPNLQPYCLATNNDPYVFVGTQVGGVRFNKDNLKTNTNLNGNGNYAFTAVALDSIGHVYFGSGASIYIYDSASCQLLETRSLGISTAITYSLCIDKQDNLYVIYYNGKNYLLRKYSSDGTLIWDNLSIPANFNIIKLTIDSNGNIYVAYINSNSILTIKKLINLVKEGS